MEKNMSNLRMIGHVSIRVDLPMSRKHDPKGSKFGQNTSCVEKDDKKLVWGWQWPLLVTSEVS